MIDTLVVGLPCNTIKASKTALEEWLGGPHRIKTEGTELSVHVENVVVIPQPFGALIDYSMESTNEIEGWALVVDPGGGTLDWFCTSQQRSNWNRSGAYPKSMLACAYAVCDAIDKDLRDNYEVVSRIDRAIRGESTTFRANGVVHEIARYEPHVGAVVNEALDKLAASVGEMGDLDLILVAGGGGAVFAKALRARYPKIENRVREWTAAPIFANVRGFHAWGERLSGVAG